MVNATLPAGGDRPSGEGLLAKLIAAVRVEFRADIFAPEPGVLVFDTTPCRVPGCVRQPRTRKLCKGHYHAWGKAGRPDIAQFIATVDPEGWGRKELTACVVVGCRYGSARRGLCVRHHGLWERAGKPDRDSWAAALPADDDPGRGECALSYCTLWRQGRSRFCCNHHSRWHAAGRPPVEEFLALCESAGEDRFDFRGLGDRRQLKLELQYALQCRADERMVNTWAASVTPVIALATAGEATSLLQWPLQHWEALLTAAHSGSSHGQNGQAAFLRYAYEHVQDLADGYGWETEFDRDVWQLRRLGGDGDRRLRFDGIPQPWLRGLVKRFLRWRLSVGRSPNQASIDVRALTRFATFLAAPGVDIDTIGGIDRSVLERYLADLATNDTRTPRSRGRDISCLSAFFDAVRRHQWDTDLPTTAVFYPDDFPKPVQRLPRAVAEQVMAQVEAPQNLNRWRNADGKVVTLILIRCGLRVGDACRLEFDPIVHDGDGAAYLRYTNHKMSREALVPLDEEVQAEITAQQRRVTDRWPAGSRWLFPAPRLNPDGARPLSTHSYRGQLNDWLARCDVRDQHGHPVHLTPHQWRHTFGTRLANKDVPQEVVRVLLDHSSGEMTAHYARLHDDTVRRHWEAARKVNTQGETITIDPDGPLAEANWAKQRLGRATQALPNGYCGLPVQTTCPHANACLTCPLFVTTAEFLPQHRAQRQETLQIISAAKARGQSRLVEMNQQVLSNLDNIITTLEAEPDTDGQEGADAG